MPALYAHSEPRKVKVDFAATHANDASTYAPPPPRETTMRVPHDGMRDIGAPGGGKRVLLLRGVEAGTHGAEVARRLGQEIARMVGKLGREKEAETAVTRVVLIVDRSSRESWGFCFAEFATAEVSISETVD
jgi:RNA-binding protein 5/10